jgi:hypothetical protein
MEDDAVMLWTGFLVALLALVGPAHAQQRPFVWMGPAVTCEFWTRERQTRRAEQLEMWVAGYLSGMAQTSDVLRDRDPAGTYAWLDNHCRMHPSERFLDAVHELAAELLSAQRRSSQ